MISSAIHDKLKKLGSSNSIGRETGLYIIKFNLDLQNRSNPDHQGLSPGLGF